jgi:nucleoside-diphosphate-sugar epimerase
MKIVIIGGTGLIGSELVSKLRRPDHTVIAAAPGSGINTLKTTLQWISSGHPRPTFSKPDALPG